MSRESGACGASCRCPTVPEEDARQLSCTVETLSQDRTPRGDWGQLRDLMPSRIADAVPRVQAARAVATRLRDEIHDRIDALDGHQVAMVPGMPGCPPAVRRLFT